MANEWECVRCTFLNDDNALACNLCASPKPTAAPAALQCACLQCTYLNGRNAAACDVCFSIKPAAATEPYMVNKWECVLCTFLNDDNALACNLCASPKPAAAPAELQWACLQCTYLNGRNAAACDVCFSPGPAAALPSGVHFAAAAVAVQVNTTLTSLSVQQAFLPFLPAIKRRSEWKEQRRLLMLKVNKTLTSLDLEKKGIGDAGAQAMGEALRVP
eukprot:g17272.t1